MGSAYTEKKQDFRSRHIAAWKESGLNIREYSEREDLSKNPSGCRRRKLTAPEPPPDHGFVELKLNSSRNDGLIHVRLRRGIEHGIVPGVDTKYLGELMNALENL